MTSLMWLISALLKAFLQCFWNDLNELHWFDFFARLYNLDLRRTIFLKLLLNQGKDFLFEQTLDGMFLSIECWMPSLKVFHNSSIEELLTEFMIESESLHMSSWILSQLALEKI